MHPRDKLKRNTEKISIDDDVKYLGQFPSHPRNRLKRKLAKRLLIHPRERVKRKKRNWNCNEKFWATKFKYCNIKKSKIFWC